MNVLLLGDSNAYRSTPYQPPDVTVDGHPGYKAADPQWTGFITRDLREGGPFDAIIVQLGTNDALTHRTTQTFRSSFDHIMSLFPIDTPVLWNLVRRGGRRHEWVRHINRVIVNGSSRYANLTFENLPLHWRGHPEWVLADHVHFTEAGYIEYAEWNMNNVSAVVGS